MEYILPGIYCLTTIIVVAFLVFGPTKINRDMLEKLGKAAVYMLAGPGLIHVLQLAGILGVFQ